MNILRRRGNSDSEYIPRVRQLYEINLKLRHMKDELSHRFLLALYWMRKSEMWLYLELDPVPGWTCAQEAFAVVLSLMGYRILNIAEICWVNKQGALKKQLDPGQ